MFPIYEKDWQRMQDGSTKYDGLLATEGSSSGMVGKRD
jgi:hypothetical protein